MELKNKLNKPYTEKQKMDFIVENNHNHGYLIDEQSDGLYAYGNTQEELDAIRKEQISRLSLTKREVFLALYKAKGITPEMIRNTITDTEALIEFDYATEYYRFNPLIDSIGATLGYTPEDLDYLFTNKQLPSESTSPKIEPNEETGN